MADRFVQLERHPLGGFGFSVIGGVDTELPPMVCAIVDNGAAQLSGKVRRRNRQNNFCFSLVSRYDKRLPGTRIYKIIVLLDLRELSL